VSAQYAVPECTAATLNGYIDPNGSATTVWFEWGASPSLSYSTPRQTFSSSSNFSQRISGLSPSTTYYYRAMAENENGGDTGSTISFTTSSCGGQPQGEATVACVVHNAVTSNPIPGANCNIANQNGTTNSDGYHAFQVPLGSQTLNVTASGYSSFSGTRTITGNFDWHVYLQPNSQPAQVCQDPSASNYHGALPCTYPAPAQVCQDPSASNYHGALPCTYPPQLCQDPSANNYRGALPCTYPPQLCQDPSANNYRGPIPCTYPAPVQVCQDPSASNYHGALPCTYPPQLCQDPSAVNYHGTLPCQYPQVQVCQDPSAVNYHGTLPCQYPQIQVCQDPSASNYRGSLPCQYPQNNVCNDPAATNYRGYLPCTYPQLQICQDINAINYRGALPCRYNTVINNQPTITIYADDTSVAYNSATFIRWSTANATSCYGSGGSVGWAGNKSIGPASFYTGSLTGTRTYTLTCTNGINSISNSVTVNVRGIVVNNPPVRPLASSLVVVSSSVDRNQPIVPTLDNTNPRPGDEINYTITYQNVGNTTVTNLNLQVSLPAEVDYMFSNPNNPFRNGNNLTFNLGTLRAGAQGTVTIRVKVRENIAPGTVLNFPAILSYVDVNGQTQSISANVTAEVFRDGASVGNFLGANIFGSGIFLPSNLFGWLLLIILILILIALGRYLFNQTRPAPRYVDRYLAPPVPPAQPYYPAYSQPVPPQYPPQAPAYPPQQHDSHDVHIGH
jgi:uncharacterized repeat protein (TIGR01451 family)